MGIYLGDLTIEQIENRLGIKFSAEDKKALLNNYQARINKTPRVRALNVMLRETGKHIDYTDFDFAKVWEDGGITFGGA